MAEEKLTVEEAAARLGLSVASVRRKCQSGEIPASKLGKAWVIPSATLPKRRVSTTRRRSRSASASADVPQAVLHLRTHDLKQDLWVPDVLRFEDELANLDELTATAAAKLDLQEPLDPPINVPVPKSPFFPRNAVNLTLADRIAYQAAVASFAKAIEAELTDAAFAARLARDPKYFLSNGRDAWLRWRRAVTRSLKSRPWMIETDVTSYFDFVKHEILLPEVQQLGADPKIVDSLREMLRTWSATPNTGIPQGPNASRVLGNFYLAHVDAVMVQLPNIEYFRFMDDMRITASSRAAAIAALQVLDQECRKRGLALSNRKTDLHYGADAKQALEDSELDVVQYAFDNETETDAQLSKRLRNLFVKALQRDGTIRTRYARFSLSRLFKMRSPSALSKVLQNLEYLAPLGELVPRYLYPWLRRKSVQDRLTTFLLDPERNTSVYLSTWLLAVMVDIADAVPTQWIDYARAVATNRSEPGFHRAVALNVLVLGKRSSDIARVEEIVRHEFDPEVVRAAVVALFRVGRLSKPVASRAARLDGLAATVSHLRSRSDLPSLLFSSIRYPV